MTKCLVALGSNLGDRAATLDVAVEALAAAAGVELVGRSAWQLTIPVGCDGLQPEFLNGAALLETSRDAAELLALLRQIEVQRGRERHTRWGSRTLDLDLLLFGDAVIDTPALIVPHPRMSFRRFVLEPAVEIAGELVHPTIGWTLERLLDHLDTGADRVAIVSPDEGARREISATLCEQLSVSNCDPCVVHEMLWPAAATTWLAVPDSCLSSGHPKLTILHCTPAASETGGGPTLRVPTADGQSIETDVFAAIEAVWPRLGPSGGQRLQ